MGTAHQTQPPPPSHPFHALRMDLRGGFVGRDEELSVLRRCIAGPSLVTLTGPTGIGKTELLKRLMRLQPHGIWIPASADRSIVLSRFSSALGVPVPGLAPEKASERLARAANHLAPTFLALDGAAPFACELVDRIRTLAPSLPVLVAAPKPLELPGETVVALSPLPGTEAATLFLSRVRTFGGRLDGTAPEVIAAFVHKVGGIPRMLELAAACLEPDDEARALEHLAASSACSGSLADRERKLMDRIWQTLSPGEQSLLQHASLLETSIRLDRLAPLIGVDASLIGSGLERLVQRGLLRSTTHDFVTTMQLESKTTDPLSSWFVPHGVATLIRSQFPLPPDVAPKFRELAIEGSELRPDWLLSIALGTPEAPAEIRARALLRVWPLLKDHGHEALFEPHVGRLLDARLSERLRMELASGWVASSDPHAVTRLRELVAVARRNAADAVEARCALQLAHRFVGGMDESSRLARDAVRLARSARNPSLEAEALLCQGRLVAAQGHSDSAVCLLRESLEVAQTVGLVVLESKVQRALGHTWIQAAKPAKAGVAYEDSLHVALEASSPLEQVRSWLALAHFASLSALPVKAATSYRRAIHTARSMGDRESELEALLGLVLISEKPEEADERLHRAIAFSDRRAWVRGRQHGDAVAAIVNFRRGSTRAARASLAQAEASRSDGLTDTIGKWFESPDSDELYTMAWEALYRGAPGWLRLIIPAERGVDGLQSRLISPAFSM